MISCFKGKFKVTSPRGYRTLDKDTEYHGGIDLVALGEDKSVYAIADGVIDAVPYESNGFGRYVRQVLPDGRRIYYAHMKYDSAVVKAGQTVKVGDKLGVMGSTGKSTGAHTHLELRVKGTSKDSLDISEFTGIPNERGIYEVHSQTDIEFVQERCGFADSTMEYLSAYKYAVDLFAKLRKAMEG
jgi:murein DD-endopeptidase MepM/ murein hydrolase activator NlpD